MVHVADDWAGQLILIRYPQAQPKFKKEVVPAGAVCVHTGGGQGDGLAVKAPHRLIGEVTQRPGGLIHHIDGGVL